MMKKALLIGMAVAVLPPGVSAQTNTGSPSIHHDTRTFRVAGLDTVYFEDDRGDWYRATTLGSCGQLPWARRIGIDRAGVLKVDWQRCQLQSVVRVDGPPRKRRG